MNEGTRECMNEWMSERLNAWTDEWVNEWTSEWAHEWMSGWLVGYIICWLIDIYGLIFEWVDRGWHDGSVHLFVHWRIRSYCLNVFWRSEVLEVIEVWRRRLMSCRVLRVLFGSVLSLRSVWVSVCFATWWCHTAGFATQTNKQTNTKTNKQANKYRCL